ncbi:hypothetical protein FRB94_013114 [Tulasnella sp. JGI-2019a]|nr:hypothetical protein FRB93_010604 [Tulasnella sp. JGI-2019a]KAG8990738.1 hypothetical protein FRB94_013114 [Tulasnella sp. JGI-2019a]KAG9025984.1 hypothetical protein FRB95_009529 [Tulasnella sp. JGI-2019a]
MVATSRWANARVYLLACTVYWGIFLFGYDTGVAGGVITTTAFKTAFGLTHASTAKINNVSSNVVAVLQGGAFFGALGSAPTSNAIGRKWTLLGFAIFFLIGAALQTAAGSGTSGLNMIYVGRVIAGVGIGGISAVSPAYVSECAPKEVRGRITGLFQIWVACGVLVSYFVNYGISIHVPTGPRVWRIPFGIQFIPAGIMAIGVIFCRESPRYLARAGKTEQALTNLAWYRNTTVDDVDTRQEMAEIEATILEEQEARAGLGWKEAFFGPGNFIRFVIAIVIFLLQQFCGQNSVSYYAPTIFKSIGYTGTTPALLASGVYGVVKVVATAIFIFFFVEKFGRKWSLFFGALAMGVLFYIVGAVFKTHPPVVRTDGYVAPASRAMAGLIYLYVVAYSFSWGPLPWVYVSDIFPNRTRHYGLAIASASQWLFNFTISKITPFMESALGYKLFITFATINILGMATFAFLIPETKGKSLEEMDILFGSISHAERMKDIRKAEQVVDGETHAGAMHHEDSSRDEKPAVEENERV